MRERKHYIEFVGQHTAGKTMTIHEIVDRSLLAPINAIYPQKIKRSRLHFFLVLPWLCFQNAHHLLFVILFLIRKTKWSWINYHAVGRHLLKMVVLHPYYQRYNFDVWLKDDMLHLLPRLAFKEGIDVKDAFSEYFSHFIYLYAGIVYIDISYEVMQQRFKLRFRERPEKRRQSREPVYERAFTQNQVLKSVLTEQTEVPILVLDGTDEIPENARKAAEFVKKSYGN